MPLLRAISIYCRGTSPIRLPLAATIRFLTHQPNQREEEDHQPSLPSKGAFLEEDQWQAASSEQWTSFLERHPSSNNQSFAGGPLSRNDDPAEPSHSLPAGTAICKSGVHPEQLECEDEPLSMRLEEDAGGNDEAIIEEFDSHDEPKESLSLRVERLPNEEPVSSAIRSWMGEGFPVHRGDVFHMINRLRKLKMNKKALGVMEWVIRERPYKLKELDYSYLLEFTCKIHGISCGERLFSCIPSEFQNELLYNNLVMACLEKSLIRLALAYMKRMRELSFPISPYVYNRLILLHSSPGHRKRIPRILTQMKADKVTPHISTYNILLKIEADDHNIERLLKIFNDMTRRGVVPNEITYGILAMAHAVARLYTASGVYVEAIEKFKSGKRWSTFDILLILYGYLGREEQLEKTWNSIKDLPYVKSSSFLLAIEAFGRIGRIERSEELWNEMISTQDVKLTKQFNTIISVYCRQGYLDKASELFKEMVARGCSPNAITYRNLALGCLKAGNVKEALETLHTGMDKPVSFDVRKSIPWLEMTHSMVEFFADIGDLENAKKYFEELNEYRYSRYSFVYNTLLRAHIKAEVYEPDLLSKMILGGARPDSETYSLLYIIERLKN